MKNQKSGLREPTHEMFTDRSPTTRALPGVFRRLRQQHGLSLNKLARLSGVSRTMLGYVEAEKYVPSRTPADPSQPPPLPGGTSSLPWL